MKKLLLLSLFSLCFANAWAQEPTEKIPHNAITFKSGFVGNFIRQDQIFSPFVHSGWSKQNYSLNFYHEKKIIQWVNLSTGIYRASLVKPYTYYFQDGKEEKTVPHSFTLINLDYAVGKRVKEWSRSSLAAGAILQNDVMPSSYNYAWSGFFGYYANFALGAWARYDYKISKRHSINATAHFPVIGALARSPYLVNDDNFIQNISSHNGFKTFIEYVKDSKIQTLNRVQHFDLIVNYDFALAKRWAVGASYEWSFVHASRPLTYLSYRNVLYLTGTFKF